MAAMDANANPLPGGKCTSPLFPEGMNQELWFSWFFSPTNSSSLAPQDAAVVAATARGCRGFAAGLCRACSDAHQPRPLLNCQIPLIPPASSSATSWLCVPGSHFIIL